MIVDAKLASLPSAVASSDNVSSAAPAPLTKSLFALAIADDTLLDDQTSVVDDVESLIVIDEPELSIAVFNSLIAATNDVFCVVVNDDKSAALPFSSVLIDLHSVANLVARSVILVAKEDIN